MKSVRAELIGPWGTRIGSGLVSVTAGTRRRAPEVSEPLMRPLLQEFFFLP